MQKKAGWETKHHKCQHSLFTPEKTVRCRDCRERQGEETVPLIVGGQNEAGPNPKKEDPTPELSQEATQKLHCEQQRLGLIDIVQ